MVVSNKAGKFYTEQELADGQQNYANMFSQEPSYTNFEIYGDHFINALQQVEGSKGLKFINILGSDGQTAIAIIPVDVNGNHLPLPLTASKEGVDSPPPIKCPNQCN